MRAIVVRKTFLAKLKPSKNRRNWRPWNFDVRCIRIEAKGDRLRVVGKLLEAEFSAVVISPGVLFANYIRFYKMIAVAPEGDLLDMDMGPDGMHVGDLFVPWKDLDAALYTDPTTAPSEQ